MWRLPTLRLARTKRTPARLPQLARLLVAIYQAVKNGRFGNRLSAPPAGSLTAFSLRPHAKTGDPGTRSPAFPSFRRGSQRRLPALGRYGSKSPALPVPASMPPGRRRVGPTATRQVGDASRQLQPVTRQQAAVKRRPTAGGWAPCRE